MPTNLPGGKIISGMGGYINVVSPFNGNMTRLDVAGYHIGLNEVLFSRGHSGTLGGMATRRVAQRWTATLKVWWDVGNPPYSLLQTTVTGLDLGCGMQLGMGSLAAATAYGLAQQPFWLAPSAIMESIDLDDSSEGGEDDVVTAQVVMRGNGLIFQLPAALAEYQVYAQQLNAFGQFNGLANLTIMQ
jgi:hypothetical protein